MGQGEAEYKDKIVDREWKRKTLARYMCSKPDWIWYLSPQLRLSWSSCRAEIQSRSVNRELGAQSTLLAAELPHPLNLVNMAARVPKRIRIRDPCIVNVVCSAPHDS